MLAEVFNGIERTGTWPKTLMRSLITLIPKGEGAEPLQMRPISVMSAVCRLWASTRLKTMIEWQERWATKGQRGYRPGQGTEDLYWELALKLEEALLKGDPFGGASLDSEKAFDRIPQGILMNLMEELGLHERLVAPLRAMYKGLRRRFQTTGASVGEEFSATNGILQGCPISVICLNALIAVWAKAVEEEAPGVQTAAFADDKWMISASREKGEVTRALQKGADVSHEFAKLTGERHNVKKTFAFGTTPDARRPIRIGGVAVKVKPQMKGVGVHLSAARAAQSSTAAARVSEAVAVARRVRPLPMSFTEKAWMLAAAAAPKGLYGSSVTPYSATHLATLRRAFMATLFPKHQRRCTEIVLTLMVQGHRVDAVQIVQYECLRLLWRMVDRRPELRGAIERVWRERARAGDATAPGPIGRVAGVAAQLGWEWVSPWAFRDQRSGRVHGYTRMSLGAWEHEIREASRLAAWRAAEARRRQHHDDFAGIADGIDRAATMALHNWKRLTGLERGFLRVIIAGGVYTQQRLHQMEQVETPVCTHCDMGVEEDQQHIWWQCPAWQAVREQHPDALAEYDPLWPACLRLNGVMPAAHFEYAAAGAARGGGAGGRGEGGLNEQTEERDRIGGAARGTARSEGQETSEGAQREVARGTARGDGAVTTGRAGRSEATAAAGAKERSSASGALGTARGDSESGARERGAGAAGAAGGWKGPPPRWLFRALRPQEEWREKGLRSKSPAACLCPDEHILRTEQGTQYISMTEDPKVALWFALRWASTRPRVVRIRADALDEAALVDVRSAPAAEMAGLSPAACARTGGDREVLYAGAVPPEAVGQPDPAMDDCSVLQVVWQRGRRRRDFVSALPASTAARLEDMWMMKAGDERTAGALGIARGDDQRMGSALGIARGGEEQGGALGTARGDGPKKWEATAWGDGPKTRGALGAARGDEMRGERAAAAAPPKTGTTPWRERVVEGFVRVYTDGAGRHNQDVSVRHAGSGGYWGLDHPLNFSVPVRGGPTEQTNIRGELLAVVLAAERDPRPLEICTDSQWTIDRVQQDLATWRRCGWRRSLNGARPDHVDLWKRLDRQLSDPARGAVHFRYVKGHAKERDVASGRVDAEDKLGNDAADERAVAGAALHGVPRERVDAARRRARVARAVQRMMLDIAWERARAREEAEARRTGGGEEQENRVVEGQGEEAADEAAPPPQPPPPPGGGGRAGGGDRRIPPIPPMPAIPAIPQSRNPASRIPHHASGEERGPPRAPPLR
eukprot:gene19407-biopygen14683